MSNFWDEGSDEDKDKPEQKVNPFYQKGGKYAVDESESEDEKRTLKTPKEKMLEMIKKDYTKVKDHIESTNYTGVADVFDELLKNNEKIKTLFSEKIPDLYLRILFLIEESLNLAKEDKTKLSSKNNKSYNDLKKNFVKQSSRFEDALKLYKEQKPSEEQLLEEERYIYIY